MMNHKKLGDVKYIDNEKNEILEMPLIETNKKTGKHN